MPNPPPPARLAAAEAERLPEEIERAIDALELACEDMGASYDTLGYPAPEREEVAEEYRSALTATILTRLTAAEAARDAAVARAERLEGALEPFARHARLFADWLRRGIAPCPIPEDFERAAAALASPAPVEEA